MGDVLKEKLAELEGLKRALALNPSALNERAFRERVSKVFVVVYDILALLAGKETKGE